MNEIPGHPRHIVPDKDSADRRLRIEQGRQVNDLRVQQKSSQDQIDEINRKLDEIIVSIEDLGGTVG